MDGWTGSIGTSEARRTRLGEKERKTSKWRKIYFFLAGAPLNERKQLLYKAHFSCNYPVREMSAAAAAASCSFSFFLL